MVSYISCLNAVAQRNTSREKTDSFLMSYLKSATHCQQLTVGNDMILSVFLNESDVISTAQLFFTFEKSVLSFK